MNQDKQPNNDATSEDLAGVSGGSLTEDMENVWNAENPIEKVGTVGGGVGLLGAVGYAGYRGLRGNSSGNDNPEPVPSNNTSILDASPEPSDSGDEYPTMDPNELRAAGINASDLDMSPDQFTSLTAADRSSAQQDASKSSNSSSDDSSRDVVDG